MATEILDNFFFTIHIIQSLFLVVGDVVKRDKLQPS